MTLGEKLQLLRRSRGLSQEQLAAELDVSRQAISKWECGDSTPDLDKLRTICTYFGVTTDYLIWEHEEDVPQTAASKQDVNVCGRNGIFGDVLLLVLLREAQAPSGVKLQGTNTVHSENEIIRQAQQFISAHIREKLSVPLVARQVDVSPSYLTVLFQKNLQISPGEYIRRIKLQESKQMIRENNLNFTEIAAALQYSTVHHFSRQFKEKFGITPTEYARSVR